MNGVGDPYWVSSMDALQRLSELGWELGTLEWLAKSDPQLHDEICRRLPDLIDSFWGRAPMADFRAILDAWVRAHLGALNLYRQRQESKNASR